MISEKMYLLSKNSNEKVIIVYNKYMLKLIASHILFFLVTIVTIFTGAAGAGVQSWAPNREDLAVMSLRSAIIVTSMTLLIIVCLIYLVIRAFQA